MCIIYLSGIFSSFYKKINIHIKFIKTLMDAIVHEDLEHDYKNKKQLIGKYRGGLILIDLSTYYVLMGF